MSKTAARLAELCAIRDRELTDAEQREVRFLARRDRDNHAKQRRYRDDPEYRRRKIERSVADARKRGWK